MKIQKVGLAVMALFVTAATVQAQLAMAPMGPPLAPAAVALGPAASMPPGGNYYYDPAVMPAAAMLGYNQQGIVGPGSCGCGAGCPLGGNCGGACGLDGCGTGGGCSSCNGGCGPGGCGLLGGGLLGGSLLSGLCGPEGGRLGPNGTGECCLPRWYDFHTEWLFWKREDAGRSIALSSDGVLGPTVLSTDDLNLDEVSGFRFTGAYLVGPSTNIEVTYFGTFNWSDSAQVTSGTDELFSPYSNFGISPVGGFPETDQASLHRAAYSSALDNGEINLRRRWISGNCLLQGSWLAGVRYISLLEDFEYNTRTDVASLDSLTRTDNDLVGFQLGGDMFVCLTGRLKVGAEVEAGVYGARTRQSTLVTSSTGVNLQEQATEDDVAFASEAGAMAVFRLTPRITLRGGYQAFYLDGVALATENFNQASPFTLRDTFLNNSGSAFYHGATGGVEWTW